MNTITTVISNKPPDQRGFYKCLRITTEVDDNGSIVSLDADILTKEHPRDILFLSKTTNSLPEAAEFYNNLPK